MPFFKTVFNGLMRKDGAKVQKHGCGFTSPVHRTAFYIYAPHHPSEDVEQLRVYLDLIGMVTRPKSGKVGACILRELVGEEHQQG